MHRTPQDSDTAPLPHAATRLMRACSRGDATRAETLRRRSSDHRGGTNKPRLFRLRRDAASAAIEADALAQEAR